MQIKDHQNFLTTFDDFLSGPYYPTLFIQHRIHRTVKVPPNNYPIFISEVFFFQDGKEMIVKLCSLIIIVWTVNVK